MKTTEHVWIVYSDDRDARAFASALDSRLTHVGGAKHVTSWNRDDSRDLPIQEFSQIPVCVFIVGPEALTSDAYRAWVISSAWFATVNPDQLCILVPQGLDYADLVRSVADDEVFSEAVRRTGVDFGLDESDPVAQRILGFLKDLPRARWTRRKRRLLWGLAVGLTGLGRLLNHLGVVALAAGCLLALLGIHWPRVDAWVFELLALPVAFLAGMHLAAIPARPNIETHRKNAQLWNWKLSKYLRRIPLHVLAFGFCIIEVGIRFYPLMLVPIGFALEIAASCLRIHVFLPLMQTRGLSGTYEAIEARQTSRGIDPISAMAIGHSSVMVRPSRTLPGPLLWDNLAARGGGMCVRTFWPPRTRLFISYTWHDPEDKRLAFELKTWLDQQGIEAFLDREGIPAASPWRGIIAGQIALASHFLFIASRQSVAGATESGQGGTCLMEVRHALALMGFSARPALAFLTMEGVETLISCAGDDAFKYLLQKGYRLPKDAMFNRKDFFTWLKHTRPNGWLDDLRAMTRSPED